MVFQLYKHTGYKVRDIHKHAAFLACALYQTNTQIFKVDAALDESRQTYCPALTLDRQVGLG